ncbi:hypothetical protein, partial [Vibrio anguillarum]
SPIRQKFVKGHNISVDILYLLIFKSHYPSGMNTKTFLLAQIHRAKLDSDKCLVELLYMMSQALMRTDSAEIDWHLMNDLVDDDILLIIVLTDAGLSINFNEVLLREGVKYVMAFGLELPY